MKIGMMSRWNTSCGVSMHTELVGRAWVEMGHNVKILAPREETTPLTDQDESYVVRCYRFYARGRETSQDTRSFDRNPFFDDFDIFVVQNLERIPMNQLISIFPKIKKTAKTVLVIHEGEAPENPSFYKFEFDEVVCFDERYRDRFLRNIFPQEKLIYYLIIDE